MNTTLRRRVSALEAKLGSGEELFEWLGVRLTRDGWRRLTRQSSGASIGVSAEPAMTDKQPRSN